MPSVGSMDSAYIPDVLRRSLGNALSVSRNERKRYNSSKRRTDRENMVESFLQRKQDTKKYVNINTSK